MAYNVPDDWGCYYYTCEYCGSRCHESEGGCDCEGSRRAGTELNCEYLEDIGYEFDWDDMEWVKLISNKIRTARKDHASGLIKKGDKYRDRVWRCVEDETRKFYHCSKRVALNLSSYGGGYIYDSSKVKTVGGKLVLIEQAVV